jgi:hypothetical protein
MKRKWIQYYRLKLHEESGLTSCTSQNTRVRAGCNRVHFVGPGLPKIQRKPQTVSRVSIRHSIAAFSCEERRLATRMDGILSSLCPQPTYKPTKYVQSNNRPVQDPLGHHQGLATMLRNCACMRPTSANSRSAAGAYGHRLHDTQNNMCASEL